MRRVLLACVVVFVAGCSGSSDGSAAPVATTMTSDAPSASNPAGSVPDVAGAALPDAVGALRAAGIEEVVAVDATGQGRLVDDSSAWVVSAQSVPAGGAVDPTRQAALFVHRTGESPKVPTDLGYRAVADVLYRTTGEAADALVADGFTSVTFVDFAGQDRAVPADATWTVTAQAPQPGTLVLASEMIRLDALPADETPGA